MFKDKLFFFVELRRVPQSRRRAVPPHGADRGHEAPGISLTIATLTTGAVVPIYDPWTQCGINNPGTGRLQRRSAARVPNRLQFPGNIIPANRISPIAKKYAGLPASTPIRRCRAAGRTENWEHNASIGGDNDQIQLARRLQPEPEPAYPRPLHPIRVDEPAGRRLRQRPDQSAIPEHFITTQVMVADTHTFNSSTVLDVRFGFMRWDYDRTPGNLGIDLVSTFGLPKTPYGEISQRSGVPGMETIPSIDAGSEPVHQLRSHLRGRPVRIR